MTALQLGALLILAGLIAINYPLLFGRGAKQAPTKVSGFRSIIVLALGAVLFYAVVSPFSALRLPSLITLSQQAFTGLFKVLPDTSVAIAKEQAPQNLDRIDSSPSITADLIEQVLSANHSPIAGQGFADLLMQLGNQYNINPAHALAFFHHESVYGTLGVAVTTHSLGNIRCTPGWSLCFQGFRYYPSWGDGAHDWFKLMASYRAGGLDTLPEIIPVYAPAKDGNNTIAYIQAVRDDVARWREGKF